MKYLRVVADTNDADYISTFKKISDKDLKTLTSMFEAIKNFKPYKSKTKSGSDWTHSHNFPESCREDLGEKTPEEIYVKSGLVSNDTFDFFIEEYAPHGGDYGIHTIKHIELVEVANIKKIL